MVRLLISYIVSVLIVMLIFTSMYFSVFETYSGGSFDGLGSDGKVMEMLYWPVVLKLVLVLAVLYVCLVLPLTWISTKKFNEKKIISLGLFVVVGVLMAGIGLVSVEPIIATDYFEYGERQELNKVLEAIGYGYTNAMVYLSAFLVGVSSWAITQLQFKPKQD